MAEHPVADQAPLHSLRAYARGKGIPEDVAVKVYEQEVQRLSKMARVKRFLSVLAEKHAKDVLREGARP